MQVHVLRWAKRGKVPEPDGVVHIPDQFRDLHAGFSTKAASVDETERKVQHKVSFTANKEPLTKMLATLKAHEKAGTRVPFVGFKVRWAMGEGGTGLLQEGTGLLPLLLSHMGRRFMCACPRVGIQRLPPSSAP